MGINIHLRNVDNTMHNQLKNTAATNGVSVNQLILATLRQGLGLSKQPNKQTYHDLDKLAGTWTKADEREFAKNIADFDKIAKELWK